MVGILNRKDLSICGIRLLMKINRLGDDCIKKYGIHNFLNGSREGREEEAIGC